MIRQYIGARYVTKIYENSIDPSTAEWEANVNYEPLVLVTYNNGSYLSKKTVPANIGNPAANPNYWVQTGFYNGQITNLQQQIDEIHKTFVTPELFGAVGDGVTDDTLAIQNALDSGADVIFGNGKTYAIKSTLNINSDTIIDLNGSTILLTSDDPTFILKFRYIKDVILRNGFLVGVWESGFENTAWVIDINLSKNIIIENIDISNTISDGIIIGSLWDIPQSLDYSIENINIVNCHIHDVGRNGLVISNGYDINIDNCFIENITNNAPKSCIDIEPEGRSDLALYGYSYNLGKIRIHDCYFKNSVYGVTMVQTAKVSTVADVMIDNNVFDNCSFTTDTSASVTDFTKGFPVALLNNRFLNNFNYAVRLRDRAKTLKTIVNNNIFENITGRDVLDYFGFIIINLHKALGTDQGNMVITDNSFTSDDWISNMAYIKIVNETNETLYQTTILNNDFKGLQNRLAFIATVADKIDPDCVIEAAKIVQTNYAGITMSNSILLLVDSTGGGTVTLESEMFNTKHQIIVQNYSGGTLVFKPAGSKLFKGGNNRATVTITDDALIEYIIIGNEITLFTNNTVAYSTV